MDSEKLIHFLIYLHLETAKLTGSVIYWMKLKLVAKMHLQVFQVDHQKRFLVQKIHNLEKSFHIPDY